MDKLKSTLLKLTERESMNYLSLVYFITDDNLYILNDYIIKNNIDSNNLCYKDEKSNIIRDKLTINELTIINDLDFKYKKYFIIIFYFFSEDEHNEFFLSFLMNIKSHAMKNIEINGEENLINLINGEENLINGEETI